MGDAVEVGRRCDQCGQVKTNGIPSVPGVYSLKSARGQSFEVPPLNWKAQRQLSRDGIYTKVMVSQAEPGGQFNDDVMEALSKIVHAALRRNYPDITLDEVEDMLDFANMSYVLHAVTGGQLGIAEPKGDGVVRPTEAAVPTAANGAHQPSASGTA